MKIRGCVLACALLLAACGGRNAIDARTDAPLVRGPIRSIQHGANASNMLVEAGPGSVEMCGISATVDSRTRYLRALPGGDFAPAQLSDLLVGDTVEVFVVGPVAESCPVQGRAGMIVLVSR